MYLQEIKHHQVEFSNCFIDRIGTDIKPSDIAVDILTKHLWEFNESGSGRHLTIYGLQEFFEAKGINTQVRDNFLDTLAIQAYRRMAKLYSKQVEFFTANRPLGGLTGSIDYIKSFIPFEKQQSEKKDMLRGLRYQSLILHRDISNACNYLTIPKEQYLAQTPKIIDYSLDSIKIPHTDAGTTISILHVTQENVLGGRSQLLDLRYLLRDVQNTINKDLTVLDLLAPVQKQGEYQGIQYRADVVLGLRPEFHAIAESYKITIPEPNRAITFFINDLFDKLTGQLSGILHGAELPTTKDEHKKAKRQVINRAVFAKIV
jgi:hypothetical protein